MNKLDEFRKLNKELIFICVSKYHTNDEIEKAYNNGFRIFGENKLQDLEKKYLYFKDKLDVSWHFIGRIQSNKISKMVLYSDLIHSVASLKHLNKINIEASKINKVQGVLLQVNLTNELTKDGISSEEATSIITRLKDYQNVNLKGIMVIGPNTDNEEEIDYIFAKANSLFNALNKKYKLNMNILSMGMSNDYKIALKNNSNCLRIGTALFDSIK